MSEEKDRENYIPFSRAQIYKMILREKGLKGQQAKKFKEFCQLLQSVYHYEFHEKQEIFKDYYRPFNPDIEIELEGDEKDPKELPKIEKNFLKTLDKILKDGNFKHVPQEQLAIAMEKEGLFPISLDVNFDHFEYYYLYYQGESVGEATVDHQLIPFMKKQLKFEVFDKVVMVLKLKSEDYFKKNKVKDLPGKGGRIYLKYLCGVPKADLEMIFPNPKPRMKLVQRIKVAVPMAVALTTFLGQFVINYFTNNPTPLEGEMSSLAVAVIFLAAGAGIRSYFGYKNLVQNLMSEITTSLYFKNMVSNQGVFTTLIDGAEEEETKEAVLAYYFLLIEKKPLTEPKLDDLIENWFEKKYKVSLDFEVDDALGKLEELGLLTKDKKGVLKVISLDEAMKKLDYRWDNYFQYNED